MLLLNITKLTHCLLLTHHWLLSDVLLPLALCEKTQMVGHGGINSDSNVAKYSWLLNKDMNKTIL